MTDTTGVTPKVLEILGENPALAYSVIADEIGVTRERVRQIAQLNGYPPRKGILKPKICPVCKKPFYKRRSIFCSYTCKYKASHTRIVVNCHYCGKPIERTPGTMRNRSGRYFCNRVCYNYSRWRVEKHSICQNIS